MGGRPWRKPLQGRKRERGTLILAFATSALFAFLGITSGSAQEHDWERSLEAQQFEQRAEGKAADLVRTNGTGTDLALKAKLLRMGKSDQDIRNRMSSLPSSQQSILIPKMQKADAKLTQPLKFIVEAKGWRTIALVGIKASQAAALILIHSPDHDFQRNLIPEMQKLVEGRKIVGADIATLIDKVLVAEGKPQRFGTQFSWKDNGPMVMDAVEDAEYLDQRREMFSLPPMSLYKRMMADMYHREVQ